MLEISIIIVNWNVKDVLKNCVESIKRNVSGLLYEVIIVDNNSRDGSVEMIEEEYPEVILIKNRQNLGYGRANNQGIRKAKGKYVLILNPDTVVLPGAVEEMYNFLEENPSVAACGPSALDHKNQLFIPMIHDPTLWELFGKDTFLRKFFPRLCSPRYPIPKERRKVARLSGCCFLSRKEALKAVGLFDERIFLFFEEADLFYRLRRQGWAIYYLPEISIVHLHGESVSLISRFQEELFTRKSSLIYFLNRYGTIPSIFLKSYLIFSYSLYVIILGISFLLSRKEVYRGKVEFYGNLLKLTSRSLFGLNS